MLLVLSSAGARGAKGSNEIRIFKGISPYIFLSLTSDDRKRIVITIGVKIYKM